MLSKQGTNSTLVSDDEKIDMFRRADAFHASLSREQDLMFQQLTNHQGARVVTAVALAFNVTFTEKEELVKFDDKLYVKSKRSIFSRLFKKTPIAVQNNEPKVRDFVASAEKVYQMRDNEYWLTTAAKIIDDSLEHNDMNLVFMAPLYCILFFCLSYYKPMMMKTSNPVVEVLIKMRRCLPSIELNDTVLRQLQVLRCLAFMKPDTYSKSVIESLLTICTTWNEHSDAKLLQIEQDITDMLQFLKSYPKTHDSESWFRLSAPQELLAEMERCGTFAKFQQGRTGKIDPVWAAGRIKQLLRRVPGGIIPTCVKHLLLLDSFEDDANTYHFVQRLIPSILSFSPVRCRLIEGIHDITTHIAEHSTANGVTIETLTRVITITGELPKLKTLADGQKFEKEHDRFCKNWGRYIPQLLASNFTIPAESKSRTDEILSSTSAEYWYIPMRSYIIPSECAKLAAVSLTESAKLRKTKMSRAY